MQLCSKPRGARGIEFETFRRRGQLLMADGPLQPGTTKLRAHQSGQPSRTHLRRRRQEGAHATVQPRKGHVANSAPRAADHGDLWKRRGREGTAAAAPRNLLCLWASALCVQPQPSRQPGERRQHPSGFACHRVCRQI